MAIESKHKVGDRMEPGEYVVHVTKVEATTSKKGDPMWKVEFSTHDEKTIAGFYVTKFKWALNALTDCRLAAGLTKEDHPTSLVGKTLGIKVEPGKVHEDGRQYMQITGYGKPSDVTGFADTPTSFAGSSDFSDVPF
jgi:hypothetical protein